MNLTDTIKLTDCTDRIKQMVGLIRSSCLDKNKPIVLTNNTTYDGMD